MELVDIIDPNNTVIGKTSKEESHQKGLLHRCVVAELIDSQGNWILVKQASDRQDAGQYVSPVGGHVQSGETLEEALKREAMEEIGIKDFNYKFIGKAIFNREVLDRKENHYFFLYEIYSNQNPVLNHESIAYKKFSIKEINQKLKYNPQIFGDSFHFVIRNIYSNLFGFHL
jgi:8-oxo-dGTP pyrophosphatase MutT (NUDIX family)